MIACSEFPVVPLFPQTRCVALATLVWADTDALQVVPVTQHPHHAERLRELGEEAAHSLAESTLPSGAYAAKSFFSTMR